MVAGRYDTFAALLTKAMARVEGSDEPLVLAVTTWRVMEHAAGQQLPNMQKHFTPLSDYLYNVLREPLKEYLPQNTYYEEYFDRFEYLLALVHADLSQKQGGNAFGPIGCFGWRGTGAFHVGEHRIMKEIEAEVVSAGENWPPLNAGLFDGSVERFQTIKAAFDQSVRNVNWS